MSTSHKDLILDKSEVRILSSLYKGNKLLKQDVDYKFKEKYSFLLRYHLIDYSPDPKYYCISKKGKMFLLYRRKEKIRFWVPIIISVIALILSVVSILMPPVIIIER